MKSYKFKADDILIYAELKIVKVLNVYSDYYQLKNIKILTEYYQINEIYNIYQPHVDANYQLLTPLEKIKYL